MTSIQTQLLTPTDFIFSPLFDKLSQENMFPDTALQSFLSSPTSPPKASTTTSSVSNVVDLDQVFSKLIGDVPQKPLCAQPWTSFDMQPLFTPTSTCMPTVPASNNNSNKKLALPPLKIPQAFDAQQPARKLPVVASLPPQPVESLQQHGLSRKWQTVFVDSRYQGTIAMHVTSKNRSEEPSEEIPDKLYSSLKYEIRQRASGTLCSGIQFLLSKIAVIDATDHQEIVKDKKSVLKGVIEASVVRPPTSSDPTKMEGTLKVQFSEVSTKKKNLCFQICYYVPSDLVNPILITRSASFLVYARKPSQGKKRKRATTTAAVSNEEKNLTTSATTTATMTTSTTCASTESLDQFVSRLDELVQCTKRFKPSERETAVKLVAQKLLELDPSVILHLSENKNLRK